MDERIAKLFELMERDISVKLMFASVLELHKEVLDELDKALLDAEKTMLETQIAELQARLDAVKDKTEGGITP